MTQAALAEKVDVTRGYLSRLEMGRHDPPLSLLRKLARALGVKVADLVE
jgi:transcriptional regulator with XRE-family HTH domain